MSIATNRKRKLKKTFEDEYRSALSAYAAAGGETALRQAYELGRKAIEEGKSLIEIARLHHDALRELVKLVESEERVADVLRAGAEFSAECLSPYEMAYRGFEDSTKALRQLNETLEEEIKRIAIAVHDEAGQLLVAVHLALEEVSRGLPKFQREQLGGVSQLLEQVETQLRRVSHELRPTVLDDLGWIPAIRFLAEGIAKRANLPIKIKTTVAGRLPKSTEIAMYRVVQEALTNASKHAKAGVVLIQVRRAGRMLCCSIQDDGAGFDVVEVQSNKGRRGLGLIGMQERLNAIGGTLSIESRPGCGTKLMIRVPME